MKWYIVQAFTGSENTVRESLLQRVAQLNMQEHFGDILVPKERVQQTRNGKKVERSRSFYPGYIFVQMNLTDETWHLVKELPKVSGFLGGRNPAPVPQKEIENISQQMKEGAAKPKIDVSFETGDHVKVITGAFANYMGTIEEVLSDKQKVKVLISIFGRATPVELEYGQVEKTA